jgi:hypothetical protein
MHIELAACRRETVKASGRRPGAVLSREQRPFHGGEVESVQIVQNTAVCQRRGRYKPERPDLKEI